MRNIKEAGLSPIKKAGIVAGTLLLGGAGTLGFARAVEATESTNQTSQVAMGDVNCDGQSNSIDAALVLQRSAGLAGSLPCETAGNVNMDQISDAVDAALILQRTAGLINRFPAENEPTPTATQPNTNTPTRTPTRTPEPTATLEPCTATFDSICIVGNNQEFLDQTSLALTLLRDHAPDHYANVLKYSRKIKELKDSTRTEKDPVNEVMYIAHGTAFAYDNQDWSLVLYAGTIVHEAEHSEAYATDLPVGGREGEILATKRQISALVEIGAPSWMTDYYNNCLNTETVCH